MGRTALVVLLFGCAVGLWWTFWGPAAPDPVVGNSDVIGGVAGIAALALTVVLLWLRPGQRTPVAEGGAGEQVRAGAEYLAVETLTYWQTQAKDRRMTTPSPAAVTWQWADSDVAVPAGPSQVLTAGVVTQLREHLYERPGAPARLVILGGPGAGKTGAMLLLLLDVLASRPVESAQPVPVWLSLGGWNPQTTSMQEWAVTTLTRDYPGLAAYGGPCTASELIRTRQVALFLDGLDEMPPAAQGLALQTIDRDGTGLHLVLTSRPTEYRAALAQGRLWGAAVIDLLPVDLQQAEEFLLAEQFDPQRGAWQHVIEHIRTHPDCVPARTLTTPLALSLARDTYTCADPAALLDARAHPTTEVLLQHLLARFLEVAYPDPVQRRHAIRWLTWVARRMGTDRDLRWWDIPTWLPTWHRRLVILFTGQLSTAPQALASRWLTRTEARKVITAGLVCGPVVGLGAGLTVWLEGGLMGGLAAGLTVGLMGGLFSGLACLAEIWCSPAMDARAATPVGVYRSDRWQALAVGLVGGLTIGLTAGLTIGLTAGLTIGLSVGLIITLSGGLTVGLAGGVTVGLVGGLAAGLTVGLVSALAGGLVRLLGHAAVQLIAAETIWRLQGWRVRLLPLLQTAQERQVLRQVGSVYQFRHAALQDLLIQFPVPESVASGTLDNAEKTHMPDRPES